MDKAVHTQWVKSVKIWVDITNAPHAHFFKGIIRELEKRGHEVLVTTREFDGLTGILDMLGVDYYVVGKHGGATLEGKLLASSERMYLLSRLIIEEKPDMALYKHSAEAPRVAFGLQIPSIGFVDNETAIGQNKLILPYTKRLLFPKAIDAYELLKCGADPNGMRPINGFSELAHLYGFIPSKKPLKELGLHSHSYIVMRTEPIKANYFNGDAEKSVLENIIPLLPDIPIVLFPRTESQKKRFEHALALGTPTISTYPGKLLAVTKWLIGLGIKFHSTDPLEVSEKAWELMRKNGTFRKHIRSIIGSMENPIDIFLKEIELYEEYGTFPVQEIAAESVDKK
ncbi:MAG: uncharacterized protein PWQ92_1505 [Thermococcaceae archaeon]|nr:uncharacterized protein [Thermococcaceae archaeon]